VKQASGALEKALLGEALNAALCPEPRVGALRPHLRKWSNGASCERREKGEGRRGKGEGRREKGEGRRRRAKGEGRREKGEGEGRREKGEGRREKEKG
jgi:hypothetical protein